MGESDGAVSLAKTSTRVALFFGPVGDERVEPRILADLGQGQHLALLGRFKGVGAHAGRI